MENAGGAQGLGSLKSSNRSKVTYNSALSKMSKKSGMSAINRRNNSTLVKSPINSPIHENEDDDEDMELEA